MEKKYNLKEEWVGIGLPVRIKKELFDIGENIHQKAVWRAIEHLLEQNKKFQKFRSSKEYKEILNIGKVKEENVFFQKLEKMEETIGNLAHNQELIWKKISENEN